MAYIDYYYSGQGNLLLAERNTNGTPKGFIWVGNVPSVTISIATTNFEHKESRTGNRQTDLVIVKEKKGTFQFKIESLDLDNLALGLWGAKSSITGATVTAESIAVDALDRAYLLAHPSVTSVVVKDSTNATTYTVVTDYILDAIGGMITPVTGGAITASSTIHVDYTYASGSKVDAFTVATPPQRWMRFNGINTIDGKHVVVDVFKAQFDPLTNLGFINEDLGAVDMQGTILADSLRTSGSQFFTETYLA